MSKNIEKRLDTTNPNLYVLISLPRAKQSGDSGRWYDPEIPGVEGDDLDNLRTVHLMNPKAGGEIRGYWLVNGKLWLRSPSYTGKWAEIDALVSEATGYPVVPYQTDVRGLVEWLSDLMSTCGHNS